MQRRDWLNIKAVGSIKMLLIDRSLSGWMWIHTSCHLGTAYPVLKTLPNPREAYPLIYLSPAFWSLQTFQHHQSLTTGNQSSSTSLGGTFHPVRLHTLRAPGGHRMLPLAIKTRLNATLVWTQVLRTRFLSHQPPKPPLRASRGHFILPSSLEEEHSTNILPAGMLIIVTNNW